jgi:hypothetical protein
LVRRWLVRHWLIQRWLVRHWLIQRWLVRRRLVSGWLVQERLVRDDLSGAGWSSDGWSAMTGLAFPVKWWEEGQPSGPGLWRGFDLILLHRRRWRPDLPPPPEVGKVHLCSPQRNYSFL